MDPQDVERLQICRDSICSDVTFDSVAPALISAGLINRDELQKILSKDSDVHRMNQVLKILPTKGPKALTKFTTVLKKDYRWLADHIMSAGASTSNGSSSNGSNSPSDQTDLNVPSTSGTSCKQRQRNSNNNNNNQTPPSSPRKIETSSPGRIKSPVVNNQQNLITECSDHITSNNENNRLAAEQLSQKLSTDMLNVVGKNYRVAQHWTTLAHALQLDNQIAPIRMKILVFSEDMNLSVTYLLKEWMSQSPNAANLGNLLAALRDNNFNDVADELETKFAA